MQIKFRGYTPTVGAICWNGENSCSHPGQKHNNNRCVHMLLLTVALKGITYGTPKKKIIINFLVSSLSVSEENWCVKSTVWTHPHAFNCFSPKCSIIFKAIQNQWEGMQYHKVNPRDLLIYTSVKIWFDMSWNALSKIFLHKHCYL